MKTQLRSARSILASLVAALAVTQAASAADVVWDGASDGDGDGITLESAANWAGDVLPNVNGDTMVWNGTEAGALALTYTSGLGGTAGNTGLNISLTTAQTDAVTINEADATSLRIGNTTLASGSGAFTLGDGTGAFNITLGGAASTQIFTNDSVYPATIMSDVVFGLGGAAAHLLNFTGTGDWSVAPNLAFASGGTAALYKTGVGTLTLSGGGAFKEGATVNGGAGFSAVLKEGTTVLDGGTYTNNNETNNGEFVVGGIDTVGTNTKLVMNNASALTGIDWLSIGRGNGVGATSSDVTLNHTASITASNMSAGFNGGNAATLPAGAITLNGASTLTVSDYFHLAESAGSSMTLTLNDTATVTLAGTPGGNDRRNLGFNGSGVLTLNTGTTFTDASTRFLNVGYQNGSGVVIINGGTFNKSGGELRVGTTSTNGVYTATGTINMTDGTASAGALTLGRGNNNQAQVNGTLNLYGGTFNAGGTGDVILGYAGDHNLGKMVIDGGTFNMATTTKRWLMVQVYDTACGQIDVNSGSLNLNFNSDIRFSRGNASSAGTNVINLNGGAITAYTGLATGSGSTAVVDLANSGAATANNSFNLNGGTLAIGQVITTSDTPVAAFNFNGGTLKATIATANFLDLGGANQKANVKEAGAVIDSNGVNVTIPQPLLHGGGAATDGGLAKNGAGTLTLAGASTYTGPTTVNGGTLTLGGVGEVNGSSGITVNGLGVKLLQTSTTAITPPVALDQGALDGTGTIDTVNVADSAANTIGAGNGAAGTLTVTNLNFFGTATLNLRANGTNVDQSVATTNLFTSGATTPVVVNVTNTAGFWTSGMTYPLITFSSYWVVDASHFTLGTVPGLNPNQSAQLVNTGNAIALQVTGESLVWTGAQSADWSTTPVGGAQNWSYLGSGIEFSTNSPVIFGDAATRFSVNLAENLSPSTVLFSNSLNDYTVSSTGGFGLASGSMVLDGTGKVTLTTTNTSTGTVKVNAGTLEIAGTGSIAASSAITCNGSLVFNLTGSPNLYANPIGGSGSVTKQGAGALTLAGANTFTGDLTLDAGTLDIANATAPGTGPGALVINGGTLDNTSGAAITVTAAKAQVWNADIAFTGTNSLLLGTGTVTLGGPGTSRTVDVAANTLGVGALSGTGYGLVKTGAGTLVINRGGIGTITGPLDIQNGIVGVTEDFYAGGLTGTGIIQNSGLVATKWTFWTNDTDMTFNGIIRNNDGTNTTQLGIVKRGTGTLTLTNNANNATHNLSVDSGRLVLNGTGTYGSRNDDGTTWTGNTSVVGNTAGANAVLEINGPTVNYNNRSNPGTEPWRGTLNIGVNAVNAGAVRMIAGTLSLNMAMGVGNNVGGGFGAFTQTGGATTVGGFLATANGSSRAVFNLSGGTYTQAAGPVTNGIASIGVMNIGGTAAYSQNGSDDNGMWLGENSGGYGILNVSGNATVTFAAANNGIQLGRNAGSTGQANLLGGTVTTKAVYLGAGTGRLNFNGGTLKANQANAAFLAGLTSAYVRPGGGTIDNGGFPITIGQPLLAPGGNGVSAAGLSVSGGGFIATPLVTITGDGTGATAVATIDANGNLTGITMTNPGTGYTAPPTFTLEGGGIGNTGTVQGSATLVANTSGGMTFSGGGTTTLGGANTYTGNTTVLSGSTLVLASSGGLKFAPKANGVSNKVTGSGNAYFYGGFTIDLAGAALADGNSWMLVDTAVKTFDPLTFTVVGFTETSTGVHQLVDGANTWTFTEATGVLSLQVLAGYASWAATNAGDQAANLDFDGDGVPNGVEYFMGETGSDFTANPGVVDGKIIWPKSADYQGTYAVETSPDLAVWTPATTGVVDHGTSVEYTLPTGQGKIFARLAVTPQ